MLKTKWVARLGVGCWLVFATVWSVRAAQADLEPLLRKDEFTSLSLSPDGAYLAATVPGGDRTALAIMRRADRTLVNSAVFGKNQHVVRVQWAGDTRVVFQLEEKLGQLAKPQLTGELFTLKASGGSAEILVGWRAYAGQTGSRIRNGSKNEVVAVVKADPIDGDARTVIVTVTAYSEKETSYRADRLDLTTGNRKVVARAPVKGASFHTDNTGQVRLALGSEYDNASQLYYRDNDEAPWRLINAQVDSGVVELPVGFSADNRIVYLQSTSKQGPDRLVTFDPLTNVRTEVLAGERADPDAIIRALGSTRVPVGVRYDDGRPHERFLHPQGEEAKLYAMLHEALPGMSIELVSSTRDGREALFLASSDRDPGSFYMLDVPNRKASFLLSRRQWIDPERMAATEPVEIDARDGLRLRGYLTRPQAAAKGASLPLVLLPHGGPFGIHDSWIFDEEVQMLATAGYAVLRVNYRGSGNYGRNFRLAGAGQWGLRMQDDLTDATRWAVAQGIADPKRICIYGGSYGAYAALMGAAKEPDLYRCAAGYVGVYDLPLMTSNDARSSKRFENWTSDWVGKDRAALAATSPNLLAARIKVPVFLAAGGEDEIAPIEHTKRMESALRSSGVPVETLYRKTEGHGFYLEENRKAFYTQLLAFLARNIGGSGAIAADAVNGADASSAAATAPPASR